MPRTLTFSPILALFLVGCDLGSLIPDTATDGDAAGQNDPRAQQGGDGQGQDTSPEDILSEEAGCCSLDIILPEEVVAGEQVDVGISLLNDEGVDVLQEAALSITIVGPDGDLGADGLSFQPMTAGEYTVYVSAEVLGMSFEGSAPLAVRVGEAASMHMALSSDNVDPGEIVSVSLEGWDVGGNLVEALDAALSVSPEGCAEVDGLSLTALTDGTCTVTASVGSIVQAASFLVDGNGPAISLESPSRGAFIGAGLVEISGSAWDAASGVAALSVNGEAVSDPADFSTNMVLAPGAHTITIEALDADGNSSDMIAGLIAGEFLADGEAFGGIQLSRSAEAVGELGDLISQTVSADDIKDAVLTGEPFYDTTDGCSGMTVTATDVSVGGISGSVTPVEGAIEVSVAITDLAIDLEAEAWAEFYGECFSTTTTDQISVAETEVVVLVSLSAEDGSIQVEVVESGALMSGVDEGMAAELGISPAALIEEALLEVMEAAVPASLEDAFAGLALSASFDVLGAEVSMDASVSEVSVTSDGVTLEMESTAECATAVMDAPGSLAVSSRSAGMSGDSAALSVDLLNRMLHLGWRSGGLNQHIPHEQLGLDAGVIGLLFPGAETLSLNLEPQLPPVALDAGAGQPLSLSLPELQVEAWGEVDGDEVMLGRVSLHLAGTATPTIRRGELSLDISVGDMIADSIAPEADEVAAAEGLEDLLGLFAGSLGGDLLGDVSLALPEALGSPASVQTDGAGWLILSE